VTRGGRVEGDGGEETRYLKAIGRDVELEEDRLDYDQRTRRLTLAGTGSRKTAAAKHHGDELDKAVFAVITKKPGLKAGEIGPEVKQTGIGFQPGEQMHAVARLIEGGKVQVVPGKHGAKHHYPSDFPTSQVFPDPSPGSVRTLPDPSLRGKGSTRDYSETNPSREDTTADQIETEITEAIGRQRLGACGRA
jgi:hypothetical protein